MTKPCEGFPSIAQYVYTAIIQLRPRDEILATLEKNGYSHQQSMVFYRNYLVRFFAYRERLDRKEDSHTDDMR